MKYEMVRDNKPLLFCDLTQSWSDVGGGVRTYLNKKRQYIREKTRHKHLLIIPGKTDHTITEGCLTTAYVKSPRIPGSPNYRIMLRNRAVCKILERHQPSLIECQDAYNLPWAAIAHRKVYPNTALVAAYMTDFPTVYVERPLTKLFSAKLGKWGERAATRYCANLYHQFDLAFALSRHGGAYKLEAAGLNDVQIVPLGVDLSAFGREKRDPGLRKAIGVADQQPILIYSGRLDKEKRASVVLDAFGLLPPSLGAKLVMLGEGPLKGSFAKKGALTPGFIDDRAELARWLASSDVYVSAMAHETFGISVIEAQASGLPVVGVRSGAMIDRVLPSFGRLGEVDDAQAMASNILDVLAQGAGIMGHRARGHVEAEFSWDRTMSLLFGEVFVETFARAQHRVAISAPVLSKVAARCR